MQQNSEYKFQIQFDNEDNGINFDNMMEKMKYIIENIILIDSNYKLLAFLECDDDYIVVCADNNTAYDESKVQAFYDWAESQDQYSNELKRVDEIYKLASYELFLNQNHLKFYDASQVYFQVNKACTSYNQLMEIEKSLIIYIEQELKQKPKKLFYNTDSLAFEENWHPLAEDERLDKYTEIMKFITYTMPRLKVKEHFNSDSESETEASQDAEEDNSTDNAVTDVSKANTRDLSQVIDFNKLMVATPKSTITKEPITKGPAIKEIEEVLLFSKARKMTRGKQYNHRSQSSGLNSEGNISIRKMTKNIYRKI